jgi:hypothetical protein
LFVIDRVGGFGLLSDEEEALMVRLLPLAILLFVVSDSAIAEIDVRGGWQVNLDCGGAATATSFFSLDENLTTGEITPLPTPGCGTITFAGAPVSKVGSCTATGEAGQVTGTSFSMPASGYATSEQILETPASVYIANCTVQRVVDEGRHEGTIIDGGTGTATRITGSLVNGSVQMYDTNDDVCFNVTGPITLCSFDMRRNDVAVGSGVTVQPNARVRVTFDTVSVAGTASVTPLNEAAAEVPANFQALGPALPIFYDVSTTASVSGPITTCYFYDDVDDNGIVDGTLLFETTLQLLHEEGSVFVDRTSSLDTVSNTICAQTTSLSQLVPGAEPSSGGDYPWGGRKLLLKRNDEGREKGIFLFTEGRFDAFPVLGGADDPRSVGATLEVISASEGVATFTLPAAGWTATADVNGEGKYAYDGRLVGGPVKKASIYSPLHSPIIVKTMDTGIPLTGPQGTVSLRFTTGSQRRCTRFGATTILRDEPNFFLAKNGGFGLTDCSDATLGSGN